MSWLTKGVQIQEERFQATGRNALLVPGCDNCIGLSGNFGLVKNLVRGATAQKQLYIHVGN